MNLVQTACGPVSADDLGRTYMHEHIFTLDLEVQQNYPQDWGREEVRISNAVAQLKALAAQGVGTLVDLTVVGNGRYMPRIASVAEQVPELNIVVATGIYTYSDVPSYFSYRGARLEKVFGRAVADPMIDMFVNDIVEGIAGTGICAGMLKCAIDEAGLTPGVERVMRAVAKAHHLTGTPITVHTDPKTETGWIVTQVLCEEEGVDPAAVVLGHSGDSADCDHLAALADSGFTLGFDRFGVYLKTSFEARAATLIEMCRRGYASQIVLSHDAACYIDWMDPELVALMPQWNYLHLAEEVIPYVLDHGVTSEQLDAMLISNPRRIFSTPPSAALSSLKSGTPGDD